MKRSLFISKKLAVPGIVALAFILVYSCTNRTWDKLHPYGQSSAPPAPCDTSVAVSYSVTIQPIIATQCATTSACHVAHGGALNYNIFANVQSDAMLSGGSSLMLTRLNLPTSDALHMPQNLPAINACDILKIRQWVYAGCPQN